MTIDKVEVNETPAYASYRTHYNAIEALRADGIPAVLDRSSLIMRKMSGAVQSQLRSSWRFLGLINENDHPTNALERLVYSQGDEHKQILREVLQAAYPFLLGKEVSFDISKGATPRQFHDVFVNRGASGETIRKAEVFFLKAAEAAGIVISTQILKARQSRGEQEKTIRANGATKPRKPKDSSAQNPPPAKQTQSEERDGHVMDSQSSDSDDPEIRAMRQLFPPFPADSDDLEEKKLWFEEMRDLRRWVMEYTLAKIKVQRNDYEEEELEE